GGRGEAEAGELRGGVGALGRWLAEAWAARDELVKAGQEAGARWGAERLALREQWERGQQALAEERGHFDAARRQSDQERGDLRGERESVGWGQRGEGGGVRPRDGGPAGAGGAR